MSSFTEERRIVIKVPLKSIPGPPEERPFTLGEAFCQHFYKRPLRMNNGTGAFDAVHIPPDVDSEHNARRWFLFDIGVSRPVDRTEMLKLPFEAYSATYFADTQQWVFKPRSTNAKALTKYFAMFKWGACEEIGDFSRSVDTT
ncbi:hypothetical protein AC579_1385 [Pseudocercospora musae]|uniref:Uncharacterized protein n=1 Tax=Pseudocercospora musae TaxID=113226 RepID=A0A139H7I2_9PEZI|nr:hypothetical protein AC579_1385 [Pseudocercospora musae]